MKTRRVKKKIRQQPNSKKAKLLKKIHKMQGSLKGSSALEELLRSRREEN